MPPKKRIRLQFTDGDGTEVTIQGEDRDAFLQRLTNLAGQKQNRPKVWPNTLNIPASPFPAPPVRQFPQRTSVPMVQIPENMMGGLNPAMVARIRALREGSSTRRAKLTKSIASITRQQLLAKKKK